MEFATRLYDPSADEGFVRSSWIRAAHETRSAEKVPSASWSRLQTEHVARRISTGLVLVGVDLEDTSTLVGWVAAAPGGAGELVVHWLYVPRLLRRLGIGARLVAEAAEAVGRGIFSRVAQTQESKHDRWIAKAVERRGLALGFDPLAGLGAAA